MLAVMWVIVIGDGHQVVHGDIEGLAALKEEIGGEVDALGLQTAHVPVADVVNGVATVKSTNIAEVFEKRHDHVLRDIENILTSLSSTAFVK